MQPCAQTIHGKNPMSQQRPDIRRAVEADRAHKSICTHPAIFDLKVERMFERARIWDLIHRRHA
jgi:hypothetical protein